MKIKIIIFFVLLMNDLTAQQTFLLYRMNGNVKLKAGKQIEALRIGQILKSNNILWLDKGASVVLICEGYNSFAIRNSGNHTLSRFLDSCKHETNSITAAYFKYIWHDLTHPHTSPESDRRKFMQNTGAVVRGCPGITIDPLFDTVNNRVGDVKIKWKTNLPNNQVSFVLFDAEKNGRLLFKNSLINNYIHLDTIKNYIGDNKEVYWNLTINGNEMCGRKFIKFWQKADYAVFINDLKKSLKIIPDSAERNYAMGFLLEAGHFIAEARTCYKRAALLKPSELRYREPLDEINQ